MTVSDAILDDMEDVLRRKFSFSPEESADARRSVRAIARTVIPAVTLDIIKEDPPDNRILECAVAAGADFIVTGDKDLLRLGRYDSIRILCPSDLLDIAQGLSLIHISDTLHRSCSNTSPLKPSRSAP